MADNRKRVVVAGATGHQGGAVTKHLLKNGFKVVAITRNPDSQAAQNLKKNNGIEIYKGDLFRPDTIEQCFEDVYGVFSVQNFWEHGYQGEIEQGRVMIDLAKRARVKHFVYNSVGSAHRNTGLAHFDSKFEIEKYLKQSGLNYTIFRPVFFMDNFLSMHNQILEGKLVNAMDNNVPLQMVAVDDIGAFVAQAFTNPDIFNKKEIDIAGDSKTFPEIAAIFSENLGHEVKYVKLDLDEYRNIMGDEYAKMVDWFNNVGYEADIDALRQNYDVELTSFKDWVKMADFKQFKVQQHK
ncbi:MAG: NmrA/HSCARG family protein [Bacteroidota bacterium]|nr:NmrA/HSCARG family protein [Bacteroidota bacterium]